ncbi:MULTISPECIES: acetyltransferase [unclassified Sporosarcina]|uniref:acetyltransferase n=1 Tax=unclassified Sporosarcina TaxID=2647733 RepID=UPI00203B1F65|nr:MULTISPECIES: acetyltransferase [unclassified Sporosarcina]GKV66222.1 putative acetyltransferase EpsM [Sporosarcina sp. NCCP-2331]GLB56258.1 putative acetyltransferase EpsM [Sporosarcina sp. NCCP-2378]
MRNVIIIGDSGHAKVVEDVVNSDGMKVIAKLDDKYETVISNVSLLMGPISYLFDLLGKDPEAGVIIGIGSNQVREQLVNSFQLPSNSYVTVIHRSAIVSPSVKLGDGVVVMPGAVINAATVIGDHVIINSASVVEHDCFVGDFAHVSPGAVLTGGVQIGKGTHVGAGASIIPQKKIGAWSIIGAGAVVTSEINGGATAVGVPAIVVKREGT